jgi:hypothetical protein
MRQRLRVGNIVYRNELNVFVIQRGAHDVPADAAEAVDTYLNGHSSSDGMRASGRATLQTSATLQNLKCYGLRQQKSTHVGISNFKLIHYPKKQKLLRILPDARDTIAHEANENSF